MINKKKKENFIKYLYPFQFSHNKGTIISFLSDIFVNFQKRSNNNFDTYTFQELIGIPMIVSDKLYYTFTMHQNLINQKQSTFCHRYHQTTSRKDHLKILDKLIVFLDA